MSCIVVTLLPLLKKTILTSLALQQKSSNFQQQKLSRAKGFDCSYFETKHSFWLKTLKFNKNLIVDPSGSEAPLSGADLK